MELTINQIIDYYANSSIKFVNGFIGKLDANKMDTGRRSAQGVCGLVIPLKGFANFSLNGTLYEMNRRTILHVGSRMELQIKTFKEEWEYVVIHYQIIHAPEEYTEMIDRHFMLTIEEPSLVNEHVHDLLQQQQNLDYMSKLQVQNVFMKLLEVILLSARNGRFENKKDTILAALEYIHVHFAEELIVGELAERFGMERRRFSYLFEQLTGLTPIQYITEYRVEKAKELLRTSNISVTKIAELVGYPDSFYFSRVFKKHINVSPSMYRKQHGDNQHFSKE